MVKIWYSVFGEGMGHAMRSAPIIEHLLSKKHKLIITAGDKAYPYLKEMFGEIVHKIHSAHFVIDNNEVNLTKTFMNFVNNFKIETKENVLKIYNQIKRFGPEIVISDFEPVSHYFASILKIPVISIDNIQVITKCEIKVDKKYLPIFYASQILINSFELESDKYLLCSLKKFPTKKENVFLVPPILRTEVLRAKPFESKNVLVYQTSSTNQTLIELLKRIKNQKFIFYGMNTSKKEGNVIFKKFSSSGFIKDLSECKAAILNGGFTGISEAVYMKKPVLIVPVKNQFEQIFNGETVKEMGIGDWHEELDENKINKFIKKISKYKGNLMKMPEWKNEELLNNLDDLISKTKKKNNFILNAIFYIERLIWPIRTERTFTIIKPDAIEKGKIGEVILRLEKQKIRPIGMKMIKISPEEAEKFYSHLNGKLPNSVFNSIVKYMSSEKIIVMVWQGKGVVKKVREICGPTDPKKTKKYHIRNLSEDSLEEEFKKGKAVKNIIHSSATREEAERELKFFFKEEELKKL